MQKHQMKWDDLRVFLQVARYQKLTSAGRYLGMDAATVGRRISSLEAALDAKLFDRSPQGYTITDTGRDLLAHAEHMEKVAAAVQGDIGGAADRLRGTVRIGAPDGAANFLLPGPCSRLARENPELSVQIVALPRVFSLSRREADVAITVSIPSTGRLKVRKIAEYNLRLYAHSELAENMGPVERRVDLKDITAIGYIPDMIFDKELDYFSKIGRQGEPQLASNSLIVQLHLALSGQGVCILPDFIAAKFRQLSAILPERTRITRNFYLVRHADDDRVARVNRTAEVLVEDMRAILSKLRRDT